MYTNFNYIKKGKHERKQAKAYIGYISSRPGKDKEVMERVLFGNGGLRLTPEQVTRLIDESPDNTLFWRFKLNPDPALENPEKLLDLRELTSDAIRWLEMRLGKEGAPRQLPFAAAIHEDHSPLAHIHAIVFMERAGREKPITPQLLDEFREAVSALALTQVADRREMLPVAIGLASLIGLQPEVEQEADPEASDASLVSVLDSDKTAGASGSIDGWGSSCPSCLVGTLNKRLNSRVYECDICGYRERHGRIIREGRRKEAERARSL